MRRTIAYLFVTSTLLLVLAALVLRGVGTAPDGAEATAQQTAQTEEASPDPGLQRQPTLANRSVETQPPPLRTEPNILAAITRQALPDVVSAPWADEIEGAILNHIAQHPGLHLSELQVQCHQEGCAIFLGGDNIPVYQMGFDTFASQRGFASAVIQSMDGGPNRMVFLRR